MNSSISDMDTDIITFEKSFANRLEEYTTILSSDELLPSSKVKTEWSYNAETVLEPAGWKALWKIPNEKCTELGIPSASVAVVMVDGVDVKDLTAEISILSNNDQTIPRKQTAFLVNLYPTVQQSNEFYVKKTADFIDKLRFFYEHLWMPWDINDDDNVNWTSTHLESRLKLFYDMQKNRISLEMVSQIQYLMYEGRRVQSKIAELEDKVEDDMVDEGVLCDLMDLHYSADQIKNKFEMYEDPYKRSLLVWKQCRKKEIGNEKNDRQKITYLIWSGGSMSCYLKFNNEAKLLVTEEDYMKASFLLQESVNEAAAGDAVILAEGTHGLLGLGALEAGGSIKGVGSRESVILKPHNAGSVLFYCNGGIITLENLTIDIDNVLTGILVQNSTLYLRNCHINGQKSNTSCGLQILSGGCVVAQDCVFSGLGSALHVYSKGETSFTACKIHNCFVGMKVQDEAKINLIKCEISECLEYGIKVEISRKITSGYNSVGSALLLNSVGEIQLSETNIRNNTLGDVCIMQRNSAIPSDKDIENPSFSFLLFNNPPVIDNEKHDGQGDK